MKEKFLKLFRKIYSNKNLLCFVLKNLVFRFTQNKKVLFLTLGLILFLSLVPLHFAQADFWDPLLGVLVNGIAAILDEIVGVIAALVKGLAELVAAGMETVIRFCMQIPTSPSNELTPEVIKYGWKYSRDLVNIFFVLILAFIGLANILRLQTYQAQKVLPSLIIIALLVNFSGVFVGFVVDIGNIITNALIEASPVLGIWNVGDWPAISGASGLATHIVEIFYYLIALIVYFIVMVIFAARVLFLWTLVIMAPLAFGLYVLPNTRKWWNQWLQLLIQWSLVGIPISFTLLLAKRVMSMGASGFAGLFDPASIAVMNMAAPFTALFLLFFGIALSIQMAPAGAQGIINWGKKIGIGTELGIGSAIMRRGWLGPGAQKFAENLRKRGQGQEIETKDQTWLERTRVGGALLGAISKPSDREKYERELRERLADNKRIEELAAKGERESGVAGPDGKPIMVPNLSTEEATELNKLQQKIKTEPTPDELREKIKTTTQKLGIGRTIARFGARKIGGGIELATGELVMRARSRDEREIKEGEQEGTGKNSRDNAIKMNQELAKKNLTNWNRVIGLLNAIIKNNDSDDLQEYMREGLLDPKKIGQILLKAQRGGPPAYRSIAKAMQGRLLSAPEMFGKEFEIEKEENGEIKRNEIGSPVFKDKDGKGTVQRIVDEIPEKTSTSDITNKILGATIDKGKAGGREFMEFGGELVIKQLIRVRGGDLASALIRRPESREGRTAMLDTLRTISPEDLHKWGADGLIRYLGSTAAQGAGIVSPLTPAETTDLLRLLRDRDLGILKEKNALKELIQKWHGGQQTTPLGPMLFRTNDIKIKEEEQQWKDELDQIAAQKATTPPFYSTKQEQRRQELQNKINQLELELQQEKLEEEVIRGMSAEKRIQDSLIDQYQEQYRSQIKQQLQEETSFLQASARHKGQALQDITQERIKDLFKRAVIAEKTQDILPGKIAASDRPIFQEIIDNPTRRNTAKPREFAGGLRILAEKIQAAEERIKTTPASALPAAEWRELEKMKKNYNEINRKLGTRGSKFVL